MKGMISLILSVLFLLMVHQVFPDNGGILPGVLKPEMIRVYDNELFVVQGAEVLIYPLKDLGLKKKIGRQGEGPGELKVTTNWYNNVTVFSNYIFIDGLDKIVFFSREGKLIREQKKPIGISRLVPMGKNFAAVNLTHIEKNTQYQCLNLYDRDLKRLKELARQESPVQSATGKTEMIPDGLNFSVEQDKIFVEKSREGFVVDIFDSQGKKLCQVKKEYKKIPVSEAHKKAAIEKFKTDPFIKQIGYEEFKKFSKPVWPDFFPAIRDITVSDKKIYLRTYKEQGGKEEWLILDLKGNLLKKVNLLAVDNAPLMAHLLGVKYHTIENNSFYYIKENEDTEEWELHTAKIK